jgi:hypothetical protein
MKHRSFLSSSNLIEKRLREYQPSTQASGGAETFFRDDACAIMGLRLL